MTTVRCSARQPCRLYCLRSLEGDKRVTGTSISRTEAPLYLLPNHVHTSSTKAPNPNHAPAPHRSTKHFPETDRLRAQHARPRARLRLRPRGHARDARQVAREDRAGDVRHRLRRAVSALGGARTLGGTATKVLWVVVCTGDMSTGSVRLRPVVPSLKYSAAFPATLEVITPPGRTVTLHDSDSLGLKVCRRAAHLGPLVRPVPPLLYLVAP